MSFYVPKIKHKYLEPIVCSQTIWIYCLKKAFLSCASMVNYINYQYKAACLGFTQGVRVRYIHEHPSIIEEIVWIFITHSQWYQTHWFSLNHELAMCIWHSYTCVDTDETKQSIVTGTYQPHKLIMPQDSSSQPPQPDLTSHSPLP